MTEPPNLSETWDRAATPTTQVLSQISLGIVSKTTSHGSSPISPFDNSDFRGPCSNAEISNSIIHKVLLDY